MKALLILIALTTLAVSQEPKKQHFTERWWGTPKPKIKATPAPFTEEDRLARAEKRAAVDAEWARMQAEKRQRALEARIAHLENEAQKAKFKSPYQK